MLNRIFPRQFDNDFRGYRAAIWLLVPVVLMKLIIGFNSSFNPYTVATSADGIPLDSYGAAGAEAAVALFALLGFCGLLFALLGALVLIRYRAMIPLMYLLLLSERLGSKALGMLHPVARAGATAVGPVSAGAIVSWSLLAMLVVGFVLSLLKRSDSSGQTA